MSVHSHLASPIHSLPIPAELCKTVLSSSSVFDVRRWAQTCHYAADIASQSLQERFRREVSRFAQPAALRAVLQSTRSVISGSVALHFIEGGALWQSQDMDVYTPHRAFDTVVAFFRDEEGYTESSVPRPAAVQDDGMQQELGDNEEEPGYGRLAGALRVVQMERAGAKVDIVCSMTDAALHPICFFWGTAVMNFLDGTRVGCAYPQLTSEHSCLVTPLARHQGLLLSQKVLTCTEKYAQREYEICMSRYGLTRLQETVTAIGTERSFEDPSMFTFDYSAPHATANVVDPEWAVQWQMGGRLGSREYSTTAWTVHRQSGEAQIPYHV